MNGGCEIIGLFTTLSTRIQADKRLAGKSKYAAPINKTKVNMSFLKKKKLLMITPGLQ